MVKKQVLSGASLVTIAVAVGGALYVKSQSAQSAFRASSAAAGAQQDAPIAQEFSDSEWQLPAVQHQDSLATQMESPKSGNQDSAMTETAQKESSQIDSIYPLHKNITTTFFWAGEEAGEDNKNISNLPSAWDEQWVKHFGGVDSPHKRSGFFPASFIPKENPFYFALPYNDFDEDGNRKQEVSKIVPWARKQKWGENESVLKNQWIKISKGGKVAYAQWQDVGPFKEDDAAYVFGRALPKSKINNNAGLDVSPAVRDYLGLADIDSVDWQFVDERQVPQGPWRQVITISQIYWQ